MGKYTFFRARYYHQSSGFGQNAPRKCRTIEIYDCGFLQRVRPLQKGGRHPYVCVPFISVAPPKLTRPSVNN